MSPSEFDLRAALREGEGDPVDADAVISAARSARHERRVRIGSALGAVVVVAGIGIGVGLSDLSSTGSPSSAGPSGSTNVVSRPANTGHPTDAPAQRAKSISCPATPDRFMLPGGDGSKQFTGTGPLFSQPVAAMRVCLYWSGVERQSRALVLSASSAQSVADTLNSAPTSLRGRMCPDVVPEVQLTAELFAVTANGDDLPPVTAAPGCRAISTNGTNVRFDWNPPTSLTELLRIAPTH